MSLFKDGVRVCQPQPLPEALVGKALFPTVTFKNMTTYVNFGPEPLSPLPFKCSAQPPSRASSVWVCELWDSPTEDPQKVDEAGRADEPPKSSRRKAVAPILVQA